MAITHNLGFPRIGARRELKFALEAYWRGESDAAALQTIAAEVRAENRKHQSALDWQPVGDFSLYDQVLDTSLMLGHVPERFREGAFSNLDCYFRVARGRSAPSAGGANVAAGEMTKWFNTNYHYIVPEFERDTQFRLNAAPLRAQIAEARAEGVRPKPVILGPLSYLWLGKCTQGGARLDWLDALLPLYAELFSLLQADGVEWIQLDEPLLVQDLPGEWQLAMRRAYASFSGPRPKVLLTNYFGGLGDNQSLALSLPVEGLHIDAVAGREEVDSLAAACPSEKVLSLGVIDGRNVWKTDLNAVLHWLRPIAERRGDRLWIAPSCSLLHVPVDLTQEDQLDAEVAPWLAFAVQKLEELRVLGRALNHGSAKVQPALDDNAKAMQSRRQSRRVHNPDVRARVQQLPADAGCRRSRYTERAARQQALLDLPAFPTTTIGSFPQTAKIRSARRDFKAGKLSEAEYTLRMQQEIALCIRRQEDIGLDVLVHGEAERNDMVEYFGEQLDGYVFSRYGWVQSYGSRCVKPPILFGDIRRPAPMTVEWATYAQSLSDKPVKGMLTGPVTILNWSFVRDDQPRAETCLQIALAIRDEVQDLAAAGVRIIQIDEAALREGLPLRNAERAAYLRWAVGAFRIAANGVDDATQIHTHMCYSEFNDIIASIAELDADVITIETSRSNMELLDAFKDFDYPNEIGPGVYDIHSPNIPSEEYIVRLMTLAAERIPAERLWVNPDCGLKTRQWEEVMPSLQRMVQAAQRLRSGRAEAVVKTAALG